MTADAGQKKAQEGLTTPCCTGRLQRQPNGFCLTSVIWERSKDMFRGCWDNRAVYRELDPASFREAEHISVVSHKSLDI